MKNESQFSNLVYDYFLLRMKFGYYQYGDRLPSIDTISREFNLSVQTVKSALQRLRSEGFLSMHNGRNTTVLYQADQQAMEEFGIRYFSERWDAFLDLYQSSEPFIIPLLTEGMRRMTEEDFPYILRLAECGEADNLFLFYCYTLQKMENPLALNLFWEISLFLGFPYVKRGRFLFSYNAGVVRQRLRQVVAYAKGGAWEELQAAFLEYQRSDVSGVIGQFQQVVLPLPKEEQLPFTWRIYRDRPQLCYDLAARILHGIYLGEFNNTAFLPSYEKMAERFGVSVSTMRRTIGMLNQIGATQSINGRGTRVFRIGERSNAPDFESATVRRSLSYFWQSFELIRFSCEGATKSLMSALTPEEKGGLIAQFERYQESGNCELALWCYLRAIAERSRYAGVREIYRTIYELFLWGYPLKASAEKTSELESGLAHFAVSMLRNMKADDADGCAETLKAFVIQFFPATERYLLSHGVRPEELRLSPAIRLVLTEE